MASVSYNKSLCKSIISKEQENLLTVYQTFEDYMSDDDNNPYFIQSEILEVMLDNIEQCKKDKISISELYDNVSKLEKEELQSLNIEAKLKHQEYHCNILGIDYFDEELFLNHLSDEIEEVFDTYNLDGNDDSNKFQLYLRSLQLSCDCSDDVLSTLSNQYIFLKEHYKSKKDDIKDEYITLYGKKIYKFDILKKVMARYQDKLIQINSTDIDIDKKNNKSRR